MSETFQCNHCGQEFDDNKNFILTHDFKDICPKCSEHYARCEETDEYYSIDEMATAFKYVRGRKAVLFIGCTDNYEDINGEFWHQDDVLDALNSRGREIKITREEYENGDYSNCDDCNIMHHCDFSYSVDNGDRYVCGHCHESDYVYCDHCETSHHCDNPCEHDESDENSDIIHEYSFKPRKLNFKGVASIDDPFIGFELEIESKDGNRVDQATEVLNILGDNVFLKHDGSLTHGFEIVSHPMTISEHKKIDYLKALKSLSSMGAKSHDVSTCGLHFHIDKREMTDSHKVRFGLFFALEQSKLSVLARRTSSSYAKFKDKNLNHNDYKISQERYEAVNWTNDDTVEVRIFKGTLKYETFLASMELCHAIFNFSQNKQNFSSLDQNFLWDRFVRWIKKRDYPNLRQYIEAKTDLLNLAVNVDRLDTLKIKSQNELKTKMETLN